jgi:plastocyanin
MRSAIASVFLLGCLAGCGGDDDASTPADAGGAADSGATDAGATDAGAKDSAPADTASAQTDTGTASEAGTDTGPAFNVVNGCAEADYVDATADATKRQLTWDLSSGKRCFKLEKGQAFKWITDLAVHPLEPFGGDTPSPITLVSAGTSITVTFNTTGTFGYHCANHTSMLGAILVVP